MTASSEFDSSKEAHLARLHNTALAGAWCPTHAERDAPTPNMFIQVNSDLMFCVCTSIFSYFFISLILIPLVNLFTTSNFNFRKAIHRCMCLIVKYHYISRFSSWTWVLFSPYKHRVDMIVIVGWPHIALNIAKTVAHSTTCLTSMVTTRYRVFPSSSRLYAPFRKISNSAQCGRFALILACEGVFLLYFQIVT